MLDMARRHSLVAFGVRIVALVVALSVLEAAVPGLGRWWRLLIALLVGFVTEGRCAGAVSLRALRGARPANLITALAAAWSAAFCLPAAFSVNDLERKR